jgi:hypothetical protein
MGRSMHIYTLIGYADTWHRLALERACAASPEQSPGAYPSTVHARLFAEPSGLSGRLHARRPSHTLPHFDPAPFAVCRCWRRPRPAVRAARPPRPRRTPATRTLRTPCAAPDGARAHTEAQGYLGIAGGYLARLAARTVKMPRAAWAKKCAASACCAYRTPTRPAPSQKH